METARIDICYRPLRIAWAIHSSDKAAFRRAIRLSSTMWGGAYNPIVMVDRSEAPNLIDLFRVDMVVPIGDLIEVTEFPNRFPHLISPFFNYELFVDGFRGAKHAYVLDIQNAILHWRDSREWKSLIEKGIRHLTWEDDDPLSDVFLLQYGAYPSKQDVGIDYSYIVSQTAKATNLNIPKDEPVSSTMRSRSCQFLCK